jgi:hypothetical protein
MVHSCCRLLSEDIIEAFGPTSVRIFSPNIDPSVVNRLKEITVRSGLPPGGLVLHRKTQCIVCFAMLATGYGCVCTFNDRWQQVYFVIVE